MFIEENSAVFEKILQSFENVCTTGVFRGEKLREGWEGASGWGGGYFFQDGQSPADSNLG